MRAALCSTGHTAQGSDCRRLCGHGDVLPGGEGCLALQGLGIAIALHTIYDGLLFSVNGGASIVNLFLALAVDGFTLVLAVLIVRRMGRIQKFSQGEGRDLMVQVRLMRRFRPDRSEGLGHMVTGLGFLGLLQVLLFLFLCVRHLLLAHAGGFISVAESPRRFCHGLVKLGHLASIVALDWIDRSCGRVGARGASRRHKLSRPVGLVRQFDAHDRGLIALVRAPAINPTDPVLAACQACGGQRNLGSCRDRADSVELLVR